MTKQEWIASTDPEAMLRWLRNTNQSETHPHPVIVPSERKPRLFACACVRQVWDGVVCELCKGRKAVRMLQGVIKCPNCHGTGRVGGLADPRSRRSVTVAERYADGQATEQELEVANEDAFRPEIYSPEKVAAIMALAHACTWPPRVPFEQDRVLRMFAGAGGEPDVQTAFLRDIFGNPFHWRAPAGEWTHPNNSKEESRFIYDEPWRTWVRWNDGTVLRLAQPIYSDRRWDNMPILADALLDAGCDDEDLIQHCHSEGPHVRGCWVIDFLLGGS